STSGGNARRIKIPSPINRWNFRRFLPSSINEDDHLGPLPRFSNRKPVGAPPSPMTREEYKKAGRTWGVINFKISPILKKRQFGSNKKKVV
ncbi:unnamed protein product, partial [Amoebophrya sp. A25]